MNIKDYLHLYLGCEVIYDGMVHVFVGYSQPYKTSDTTFLRLEFRPQNKGFREIKYTSISITELDKCKPILRPLSDMTEEECGDVYTISRDRILHESSQDFDVIKNKNGLIIHRLDWLNEPLMFGFNGQIYSVVEDGNDKHIEPVRNQHQITAYLLSKHFDLFGLIDAGLAIDKTTL